MDGDHVEPEQAKGLVMEAIGKITGNPMTKAEGAARKSADKEQPAAAKIKDRKAPAAAGNPG